MNHENVEIKQMSFGIHQQGVYVISSQEGLFEKMDGNPRTFKYPSGAIAFLKKACEQYSSLGYIITMPNGKVVRLGKAVEEELSEEEYGPHVWGKKNLVTVMSREGSYDIYKCKFCGKEEKSFGLYGHSIKSGTCKKNPIKVAP